MLVIVIVVIIIIEIDGLYKFSLYKYASDLISKSYGLIIRGPICINVLIAVLAMCG